MSTCLATLAMTPALTDVCTRSAQLAAVKSGAVQMFGVNLGSWLVLEQYMKPSLYAMVANNPYGERQLMQVRTAALQHNDCSCESWSCESS